MTNVRHVTTLFVTRHDMIHLVSLFACICQYLPVICIRLKQKSMAPVEEILLFHFNWKRRISPRSRLNFESTASLYKCVTLFSSLTHNTKTPTPNSVVETGNPGLYTPVSPSRVIAILLGVNHCRLTRDICIYLLLSVSPMGSNHQQLIRILYFY